MRNFVEKAAKYYEKARHRAKRRKSSWNVLLLFFGLGACLAAWFGLFRFVWLFHVKIYPEHSLRDFWQTGISFHSFILSFLMVFSLMPAALTIGFLVSNSVFWLIKPIRWIFDTEARGYAGTSFPDSMRFLLKAFAWTLPIGLGIASAAAYFMKSLR